MYLLVPCLLHGPYTLTRLVVSDVPVNCKPEQMGKLIAKVLHKLSTHVGHVRVGEMWRSNNVKFDKFVGKENVDKFIQENVSAVFFSY